MKTNKLASLLLYLLMITVSIVMIFPFVWMTVSSFKPSSEILSAPLKLITDQYNLNAYNKISSLAGLPIVKYIFSSVVITLGSTIVTVIISSLGAYSLFRKPNLPGFRLAEVLFLIGIMYPAVLLMMPLYVTSLNLGLLGSYTGIILILAGGAWGGALPFFLFRQFFGSIPVEVVESAQVDGSNEWKTLVNIIIPMAAPIYATVTLIAFMFNWGAWLPVIVISQDASTFTLAAALMNLNSELGIEFQTTMALSTVVTLPIIIMFLLTQKRVIEGIAAGSVKG